MVGFRPLRLVPWLRRGVVEKLNTAPSSDTIACRSWRDELAQMRDLVEEGLAAQQRMLSSCLEHLIQQRGLLLNVENGLINRVAEVGQRIEALQSQVANQLGNLDQRLTNDLSDLRRGIIAASRA